MNLEALILKNISIESLKNIRFTASDFFDILIVAGLIYFAIILFKKTKTLPILVGIFLLFSLYGISFIFNLSLTQSIFRSFFEIFLIIVFIVFQKEIRRFFELIGVLGLKRKILPPSESAIHPIIRAVKTMADKKIGALIVLPGKENFDRHLEGGKVLNGKISESLLLSLFDSSSPGHDGAVIIEGDTVRKFAVHLPLAENIDAVRKFGTRHRAALGLSEVSDALCIIISEERGTISLAYNKTLNPVANIEELEQKLFEFINKKFPKRSLENYKEWAKKNAAAITTSILLSSSVWLIFSFQTSEIQRQVVMPVEFKNVPQGFIIENYEPKEIIVTLSGKESDFEFLKSEEVKTSINIANVKPGWRHLPVEKEEIIRPVLLDVIKIDPKIISVQIKKTD